jgi:recombination protein RecT
MTTAITKSEPVQTLRQRLAGDYFKQQIALSLPKHMTPDRFVRVGLTALMKTPKLLDCTPESVIQCMLNCSALGLEPDGRRAHLIPYGNVCTLIVDYKGIVELAKRSGDVSGVFAQVVCDKDNFSWENGVVKHQIDWKNERGTMYACYATITFKDGSTQTDVMTKGEVDAIRKRSKASGSGPWVTDYNEMAKKTVFRRASKWITLSPEVAEAMENEDAPFNSASILSEPIAAKPIFDKPAAAEVIDEIPMGETPPPEPAESDEETAKVFVSRMLTEAKVPFDDLRDYITNKNIAKGADSWASYDEIPQAVFDVLAQVKTLSAIIKLYGTK